MGVDNPIFSLGTSDNKVSVRNIMNVIESVCKYLIIKFFGLSPEKIRERLYTFVI